jgi:ATP diphosphatase
MGADIQQLLTIMRNLRDPQSGCPWDLQQDFASIAPYTIEEAYEVADAIQRGNLADLQDELGDLLLQVVFHAQMAQEQQAFDFNDVVQSICSKMIRRHPHVFAEGDEKQTQADTATVRQNWETIKQAEREQQGANGLLDGIPRGMAELQRAFKLQKRAATVGFDWDSAEPVMAKLREETAELEQAMTSRQQAAMQEELGDLLFTLVNLARKLHLDASQALRMANAKFETRFRAVEQIAGGHSNMREMDIVELEQMWQSVKSQEQVMPESPGTKTDG